MDNKVIESKIEAILFAAGEPIPAKRISMAIGIPEDEVFDSAKNLSDYYSFSQRGITLVRTENKLQLCSSPLYGDRKSVV